MGIERMFQQVAEVFHLATLIGGSPEATVFQLAFCLLLYNMIQVVRASLAATPAEYGGKTSVVIVATTRSGQGVTRLMAA